MEEPRVSRQRTRLHGNFNNGGSGASECETVSEGGLVTAGEVRMYVVALMQATSCKRGKTIRTLTRPKGRRKRRRFFCARWGLSIWRRDSSARKRSNSSRSTGESGVGKWAATVTYKLSRSPLRKTGQPSPCNRSAADSTPQEEGCSGDECEPQSISRIRRQVWRERPIGISTSPSAASNGSRARSRISN